MIERSVLRVGIIASLLLTAGCSTKAGEDTAGSPVPPAESPAPEPEPAPGEPGEEPGKSGALTNAECKAQGGTIVGDIGDGAIHRPDYRCSNGQPPIKIHAGDGEPIATEGSVCCPAGE